MMEKRWIVRKPAILDTKRVPCFVSAMAVILVFTVFAESVQGGSVTNLDHSSGTAPEPPTKLTVEQDRSKKIIAKWSEPAYGDYTEFRLKVIPLTERNAETRDITVERGKDRYEIRDLSPGAAYQLVASTLLHDRESAFASCNFTVRPRSPSSLLFWFRNETSILAIWQPPFPPGFYTQYKVSIKPPDARESELWVKKEDGTPAPAQSIFLGLIPGRAYVFSVQTVSEPELSAPLTGQQRTVPLHPRNLTVDPNELQETSFQISWSPPVDKCEFDKYQVSLALAEIGGEGEGGRRLASKLRTRDKPTTYTFEDLEPGAHYTVSVKTLSGKVTSSPSTVDVTLKPLAVFELRWRETGVDDAVLVQWQPADGSTQDSYKVSYHKAGSSHDSGSTLMTPNTEVTLKGLLPGCNYTIWVSALSSGEESEKTLLQVERRPSQSVL